MLFLAFFAFLQLQFWGLYIIAELIFYPIESKLSNYILRVVLLASATILSAWECWLIVRWRRQRNRSRVRRGIFGPKPPADRARANS
jgi:hypothetical protein